MNLIKDMLVAEGIGIIKERLPDGRDAIPIESKVIPEEIITIPERIEYPDLRSAFPAGTFSQGDIVVVSVQVYDSSGTEKNIPDNVFKLPLENYTRDETKEVLGVLYFNFTESNRVNSPIKEEIKEDILPIKG